ncbi:MAG: hypothetical protein BWZ10_01391 [candidate division BRC1 bacterium ADurb.BinA364]|nr:MAG: hypothetical protein BWZ10_01391 [candidate division BRC1 bacterium ADurb.BinA364]
MSEDALAAWMVGELENGVAGTPLRAGFIKIAADKEPLNEFQKRQLRAAARASIRTGAAIASHTPSGARAIEQADFLADSGARLNRFVWVHAQNEKDMAIHKALASRGVYIEYDAVGRKISDAEYIAMIELMIGSGFADRLLLSHDAGWYRPGEPNGGAQMPFTHLIESFLPAYKAAGASPESIEALTQNNPFSAFAMPK